MKIIENEYENPEFNAAIINLLNYYAKGITGKGNDLSDYVKTNLTKELKQRPNIFSLVVFSDTQAVGVLISIVGFSTFACKNLLNIHDIFVLPEFRRKGVARALLEHAEKIAGRLDCCKITLEVLENNTSAVNLYRKLGFINYQLDPNMGNALFMEKKLYCV
jgi:ribosomal protein S18 acetylase RimI-like enzyme